MKKIIAKEVKNPDFSFYFDNDGLKAAGGDNCAVYICHYECYRRLECDYNTNDFNYIVTAIEGIIDAFDDIKNGYKASYGSYKEVMENYEIKYNSAKCHDLKEWAFNADINNPEDIAEYLTITTGKSYSVYEARGYSQGDYAVIIYCDDVYTTEEIKEVGAIWLGCASEFKIIDGDDEIYGYYVPDTVVWGDSQTLTTYLADAYGCKPEEIEVELLSDEDTEAI